MARSFAVARPVGRYHSLSAPGRDDVRSLEPHDSSTEHIPWRTDGVTAEPGRRCSAVTEARWPARCLKAAIVLVEVMTFVPGGNLSLCGAHFTRHRHGQLVAIHPDTLWQW